MLLKSSVIYMHEYVKTRDNISSILKHNTACKAHEDLKQCVCVAEELE